MHIKILTVRYSINDRLKEKSALHKYYFFSTTASQASAVARDNVLKAIVFRNIKEIFSPVGLEKLSGCIYGPSRTLNGSNDAFHFSHHMSL